MCKIEAYRELKRNWGSRIIRTEWRIRTVAEVGENALAESFVVDWRRYNDGIYVLEERYIKDGVEEPWEPFCVVREIEDAFEMMPGFPIVAVSERFKLYNQKIDEQLAKEKAEKLRREEKEERQCEQQREKLELRIKSEQAFQKLKHSKCEAWRNLPGKWNAYFEEHKGDKKYIDTRRKDEIYMKLYMNVLEAVTMASKAKAIRLFFEYVDSHPVQGKEDGS